MIFVILKDGIRISIRWLLLKLYDVDKQFLKFHNKQGCVIGVMNQATAPLASLADIFPI